MQQTVVIPLWKYNASSFNIFLRDTLPEWSRAQIADKGKYLGFVIGPGRGQDSWSTAVSKYKKRAQQWACLPIGLFRGCQCYKTFVFSVLSFLLQLEDVPNSLFDVEAQTLRKFAPGPGNRVQNSDLFNLDSCFGFPLAFPSLRTTAVAAKLRIAQYEVPRVSARAQHLTDAWLDS